LPRTNAASPWQKIGQKNRGREKGGVCTAGFPLKGHGEMLRTAVWAGGIAAEATDHRLAVKEQCDDRLSGNPHLTQSKHF